MSESLYKTPKLIELPSIGSSVEGFISVAEYQKNIPFEIRRVYWTYFTPQNVIRGYHAHKELQQIIFAVSGRILFKTEDEKGVVSTFTLDEPKVGLYIPPFVWREITFSHNAVLLCLASIEYDEKDYIRNYADFKKLIKNEK
ncbi:MAG: dTDP-6-deoxy-3,4-keto-hexulose isomerase [Bacteroidetes bacterium]|nr:dTDP-6-deoxy-3,4-keto-hexulose isomerase [Bacteroidota bacterium]